MKTDGAGELRSRATHGQAITFFETALQKKARPTVDLHFKGRDGPPSFAKATAGAPGGPFSTPPRPAVAPYPQYQAVKHASRPQHAIFSISALRNRRFASHWEFAGLTLAYF
jgi:hypothetical protein